MNRVAFDCLECSVPIGGGHFTKKQVKRLVANPGVGLAKRGCCCGEPASNRVIEVSQQRPLSNPEPQAIERNRLNRRNLSSSHYRVRRRAVCYSSSQRSDRVQSI